MTFVNKFLKHENRSSGSCKSTETNPLCNKIVIISDKTGPESLSWLTGYGVIGLYLSVVLLCGRYTRAIFQYDGNYILFHEYPNVDDMLQLCLGKLELRLLKIYMYNLYFKISTLSGK